MQNIADAISRTRIIIAGMCLASVIAMANADSARVFEQLQFAAQPMVFSGEFMGNYERVDEPKIVLQEEIEEKIQTYERQLRDDIRKGSLTLRPIYRERLRERYGTEDYTKLLGVPEVNAQVESYINDNLVFQRKQLVRSSQSRREVATIHYMINEQQELRFEKKMLEGYRNDKPDAATMDQSRVVTVNRSRAKECRMDTNYGSINFGTGDNPEEYKNALVMIPFFEAGRPHRIISDRWRAEDVQAVQEINTDEKRQILEVVLLRIKPDKHHEIYILRADPNLQFAVVSEELYDDGKLIMIRKYDDYREISKGLLYPLIIHQEQTRSELPAALQKDLIAGRKKWWSDEVRRKQVIVARTVQTIKLSQVRLNCSFPSNTFDQEFPKNIWVHDKTRLDVSGEPLRFYTGIHESEDEAAKAVADAVKVKNPVNAASDLQPKIEVPKTTVLGQAKIGNTKSEYRYILIGLICISMFLAVLLLARALLTKKNIKDV